MKNGFIRKFATCEGILFAIALVFTIVSGQPTLNTFAGTLMTLGVLMLVFSASGVTGSWGTQRTQEYLYSSSVSEKSLYDHTAEIMRQSEDVIADLLRELPVGLFPILVGGLLAALAY